MTDALTAEQMRAAEAAAIESGKVTGLELMERAGRGVVEAILAEWPNLRDRPGRAYVVCGPGNNGGDGFVVARLLAERDWRVRVYLLGDPARLPPDARTNYERWCEMGDVMPYRDAGPGAFNLTNAECDARTVIVDALFGTGLERPLRGANSLGRVTQACVGGAMAAHVVAVDMPSGLDANSGRYLVDPSDKDHQCIQASLTVTFHRRKRGHDLADGPAACGRVVVVDIGL